MAPAGASTRLLQLWAVASTIAAAVLATGMFMSTSSGGQRTEIPAISITKSRIAQGAEQEEMLTRMREAVEMVESIEFKECIREVKNEKRGAVLKLQENISDEKKERQKKWCHGSTQHVCKVNFPDKWQRKRDLHRVLAHVASVMARYRMTYWIDYGTLLGAVRDSGVIPWDLDVDVGVLDSELEEHWESIRKDLGDRDDPNDEYKHREMGKSHGNRKLKVSLKEEPGFYIDIYPWLMDAADDDSGDVLTAGEVDEVRGFNESMVGMKVKMMRRAGWDIPLQRAHVENRDIPQMLLFPLQSYKGFGGLVVPIAAHPEQLLDWRYGPSWHVPKPERYYRPDLRWGSDEMMSLQVTPTFEDIADGTERMKRLGLDKREGLDL